MKWTYCQCDNKYDESEPTAWYSTAEDKWFCCSCGNPRIRLPQITPDKIAAVEEAIDIMDDPRHDIGSFTPQSLIVAFADMLKGDDNEVS